MSGQSLFPDPGAREGGEESAGPAGDEQVVGDGRVVDDPRSRPPDPAGTQPKVDPESLLPERLARPVADAVVVDDRGLLPERVTPGGGVAVAASDDEPPHASRFQFTLGALIALAIAALAATAAVIVGSGPAARGTDWSAWRPSGSGISTASQIAAHIGPEYRLPSGQQLVAVTGGPLQVAGYPVTVALRSDPAANGAISLLSGKGVLYRLCGLGLKCAIDQGKPSVARHLLLQREALELALYTFRYVSGIDQVVVFMPPPPGKAPSEALLFRPSDIGAELALPLQATLVSQTPSVNGIVRSPDLPTVQRVTNASAYSFTLTQSTVDASVFLVLRPFVVAPKH